MHKIIKLVSLLALGLAGTAASASDVNFGVSVGGEVAPGVYGRVNVGNTPPPLVYAQPMVIVPSPRPMRPIYLNVPPGHAKNWGKHCHRYNACNQPVYFVRTAEYGGYDGGRRGEYRDRHDHDHDHDDYRGDRRGDRDDDHPGKGHGHGKHKH